MNLIQKMIIQFIMNIVDFITEKNDSLYQRLTPGKFFPLLFICLIFIGLTPLLIPGIPYSGYHDLTYHLSRLHAMDVNLSVGEFPSVINHELKNGYGYGTGLFYPNVFLYPAVFVMKCGFSIITAYKLLIAVTVCAAALSAYYCAWKISQNHFCAFSAALLHTWSSYFAVNIFTRAAVGEYSMFVFIPWILLGLYEIILGDPRHFLYLSFGFAGLLCSHRLSPLLAGVICFVFCLLNFVRFLREPRRILYLALSTIPAILVSAACIVPMLEQLRHFTFYIEHDQNVYTPRHVMPFLKLFLEIPNSKIVPWIPSGIGIMLTIVAMQRFRLPAARQSSIGQFGDMTLIAGLACLLMSTEMPSWEGLFKPLDFIQFPWRFFAPATAFLAFGGGQALSELVNGSPQKTRHWFWMVVFGTAFSWFVNVGYDYAVNIYRHQMMKDYHQTETDEKHYLMNDLNENVFPRGDIVTSSRPINATLARPRINVLEMTFDGNSSDNEVELPVIPYYGYVAKMTLADGSCRFLKLGRGPNKLLSVGIPSTVSSGTVAIRYRSTFLQRLSYCISVISTLSLVILFLCKKRRRHS